MNGLEMIYNAIGGAGGQLSGRLRENELRKLQEEQEAIAQAERNAFLADANAKLAEAAKADAQVAGLAGELGVSLPAPGSIDEAIFKATGGLGMKPLRPSPVGGGTSLPRTPKTEWAPAQAESLVQPEMISAARDLLRGRPSIDTSKHAKILETLRGLALRAQSRPSTASFVKALEEQQKLDREFMTADGSIADAGRTRQGVLTGMLMNDRSHSAMDRQRTEYQERQQNWRTRQQIASQERIAKDREETKKKDQARLEARELRLQAEAYSKAGQREFSQKLEILAKMKDVEAGDLTVEAFKAAFPDAKTEEKMFGGQKLTGYDFSKMINDQIDRTNAMKQYNYLHGAEAGIVPPVNLGNPVPTSLAPYAPLPNLNDPNNPRVFGAQKSR